MRKLRIYSEFIRVYVAYDMPGPITAKVVPGAMKVFKKGSEVIRQLENVVAEKGDIRAFAKTLADQAQKDRFTGLIAIAEWESNDFHLEYYQPVAEGIKQQLLETLERVRVQVKQAEAAVAKAKQWLPFLCTDDRVELEHDELIELGFADNARPQGTIELW